MHQQRMQTAEEKQNVGWLVQVMLSPSVKNGAPGGLEPPTNRLRVEATVFQLVSNGFRMLPRTPYESSAFSIFAACEVGGRHGATS
jgi:hypothetical protein